MGFDENKHEISGDSTEILNTKDDEESVNEPTNEKITRKLSEDSVLTIEDDEDEEDDDDENKINLGPQCSLKDQLEKDKVFYLIFSTKN